MAVESNEKQSPITFEPSTRAEMNNRHLSKIQKQEQTNEQLQIQKRQITQPMMIY